MGNTTFHYNDSAARSKEVESIRRNHGIRKQLRINKSPTFRKKIKNKRLLSYSHKSRKGDISQ